MDVELEMGWEWGEFRPRRWLLALLGIVLLVVLLWLLGRGHTPMVSGRPAVLTPHRKAVLDYLARADGWLGTLEGLGQTLEGLTLANTPDGVGGGEPVSDAGAGWTPPITVTEEYSLSVPVLPTATPMPVIAPIPLPGDLLARVERLDRVRLVLERVGAEMDSVCVPAGMEGVHRRLGDAVGALLEWDGALLQYYSAPGEEALAAARGGAETAKAALSAARRSLAAVRAVVLGGGEW